MGLAWGKGYFEVPHPKRCHFAKLWPLIIRFLHEPDDVTYSARACDIMQEAAVSMNERWGLIELDGGRGGGPFPGVIML